MQARGRQGQRHPARGACHVSALPELHKIRHGSCTWPQEHLPEVEFIDASTLPFPEHHRPLFPGGLLPRIKGWIG